MALLTGPIPRVAVGEIIEESWGDSVAQSLNNMTEMFAWTVWNPGAGVEFLADTAGLMSTWFTVGGAAPIEFDIPDWAAQAFVTYNLSGVTDSAPPTSYLLQAQFGPLAGRQVRYTGQSGWFGLSWGDRFLSIEDAIGDRTIKIKAQRIEGSGSERWRFYDQSDIAVHITFQGSIKFYPGI